MESKVFSCFMALFSRLVVWFDESACGKWYKKICARCYQVFSKSFIGRFFIDKPKSSGAFQHSFIGKIFGIPARILLFLQKKLAKRVRDVVEKSILCKSIHSWLDVSIRFYGVTLLVFSMCSLLIRPSGKIVFFLLIAAAMAGAVMILINRSLRQLFSGSAILQSLFGLLDCADKEEHLCIFWSRGQALVATAAGVVASFLCLVLGAKLFFVLVAVLFAFVFLLKYLRLGVFLTVVLSPMLPTMALVGLSFLCAAVFCIHVIMDESFTFSKNPVNAFVVFFVLALLWGSVNSFAFTTSLSQAAVHISFILFYFIVVNTIRTRAQWLMMIKMFLVSAFVVAVYGVLQNFLGVTSAESWLDEEMFSDIQVRVYSFFNNPNVLGEFLVLTIPVTLAVIWGNVRQEHKAVFLVIFLAMAACMIFTWSRGAWLGMVISCALFFVIMDRRWAFLGVLAVLVLPLLLTLSGNTAILERLLSIGNTSDTSTAYRVSIWQASIHMIRDFWISGIGIGSKAFQVVYPVYALSGADFALHSHNLYLQMWVEMGIIGIATLFALIISFIRQTFSGSVASLRKSDPAAKIVIALGAGVLGFLFQGLTDYVWYNYKMLMIFWIMLALGVCGANIVKSSAAEEGGVSIK